MNLETRDVLELTRQIAKAIAERGGRAYYVGGWVRDRLLGLESKDIDIEVHGLKEEELVDVLQTFGTVLSYGKSFGIYVLSGTELEFALPRTEVATGEGHRDFAIEVNPNLDERKAASRRDFTINAMMQDILTGEVLDYYNGQKDLQEGIIRHVNDEKFAEDPLRVLRAARFAATYDYKVADETIRLCKGINLGALPAERVEGELRKTLENAKRPSRFFEVLRQMEQLEPWFVECKQCIDVPQDPHYHPEGDVWTHSMQVLDAGVSYRPHVANVYAFMLLCLTHDFGKIVTTQEIGGRIHAYGHEIEGMPLVESFLNRVVHAQRDQEYVTNMVPLHMRPNMQANAKSSVKSTNHLFDEAIAPRDLIYFAMCDRPVFVGETPFQDTAPFLFERYQIYEAYMAQPHVTGRDLVAAGIEPGPQYKECLTYAHKLHLAGIGKEEALKQTLSFYKKLK